ncbi:MAG: M56 family metallopeptidase [Clostridia bacterium]|nr:M56 family metallopeptidase [Clostridia bacterium]
MLESIFKAVLCMSTAGAILSGVLLAARPLTKKIFGCKWNYYIWIVVIFVLLVPFSFKIYTATPSYNNASEVNRIEQTSVIREAPSFDSEVEISETSRPMMSSQNSKSWLKAISRIWIFVSVSLFVLRLWQYIAFLASLKKHSRSATPYKKISVCHTDLLSAPLTVGFFQKKIYIPESSAHTGDEEYILKHEYTHIKHMDILFKWVFMTAKCIHWFNPFVYIISKMVDEDCEHVCDMAVTKHMTECEKKEYMNAILNCISKTSVCASSLSTRMAGHSNRIIKRFEYITKNPTKSIFCTSISALLFICFVFAGISTSAIAITKTGDKNIPSVTINLSRNKNPSQKQPIEPIKETDTPALPYPENKEEEYQQNIDMSSKSEISSDEPAENSSASEPENTDVAPIESADVPNETIDTNPTYSPVVNQSSAEVLPIPTTPATDEEETSQTEETTVSYPGDMMGVLLLEDWNYDKMVNDLEAASIHQGSPAGASLNDVYISGELSYESGNVAVMTSITPSKRGRIDIYVDSEFEQLIEICFEQDGKQISGFSFVPDGESLYAFGGFDPQKQYDIIIKSSTGSTWKTTAQYIVC